MAQYENEFGGIPARFVHPRGADPNFRDGYRGMRMTAERGRAPYGAHRLDHVRDLETAGGFGGVHPGAAPSPGEDYPLEGAPDGGVRRYDDPEFLREYNAHSPALGNGGRKDRDTERRQEPAEARRWALPRDYRPGYSNRGMTEAGYGEHWARFPMRGGR